MIKKKVKCKRCQRQMVSPALGERTLCRSSLVHLRFSAKLKWCRICSICIQVYCKYAGKRFLSIDAASVMMSDVNPERNLTELTV